MVRFITTSSSNSAFCPIIFDSTFLFRDQPGEFIVSLFENIQNKRMQRNMNDFTFFLSAD